MNLHLYIQRDPPQPVDLDLYVLLHDFECAYGLKTPYLPRVYGLKRGTPETIKCLNSTFEEMNKDWQMFWYNLLKKFSNGAISEERLKTKWADLTHGRKAFTNGHGSEDHRDYINEKNMTEEEMAQENVTTCGNVVLAVGAPVKKMGEMYLPVRCIDRNQPPPPIDEVFNKPWLIHRATICRPEPVDPTPTPTAPNGTFRVIRFHHLDGRDVPVPFITKGGINYIKMERVRKLAPGEPIPSPYVF